MQHGRVFRAMLPLLGLSPWLACSSTDESGKATGVVTTTGGVASGTGGATGGIVGTGGIVSSAGGVGAAPASGGIGATGGMILGTGGGVVPPGTGGNVSSGGASGGRQGGDGGSKATGGSAGGATGGSTASGTGGGSTGAMGPSAGCGKATTLKSGRTSIDVGGKSREYILALPENYDQSKPYRLIFGWHPLGGSAEQVAKGGYYGLQAKSDGSAIFVSPEGLPFQGSSLGWGNQNGADIDFLKAMLARFRSELCIDENRIFSTGFSFGGMFSFASACSPDGMMRAVAPQAGNSMVSGCMSGTRSVALMGFHGVDDNVVQIDGGRRGRDIIRERNGCSETTMPVTPSWCDGLNANNQPCECVSYQGCKEGYPVIWCEFKAGHTPAPNSGSTIWNFFAQF